MRDADDLSWVERAVDRLQARYGEDKVEEFLGRVRDFVYLAMRRCRQAALVLIVAFYGLAVFVLPAAVYQAYRGVVYRDGTRPSDWLVFVIPAVAAMPFVINRIFTKDYDGNRVHPWTGEPVTQEEAPK
jgi:hypothetical protein